MEIKCQMSVITTLAQCKLSLIEKNESVITGIGG